LPPASGAAEADTEFARYALAGSQDRANMLKEWVKPDLLIVDDLFLASIWEM
jgi:hypothetical protein